MSYIPIASQTLTTNAASVTFSSIPQGFRDLVFVIAGQMGATAGIRGIINGDTTFGNYSGVFMAATTTATSGTYSNPDVAALSGSSQSMSYFHIFDYSQTDKHKTILSRNDRSDATVARAVRWANTNAITEVSLQADNTTFNAGTTFALYGIEA
jgi:hypothetical protein